MSTFQVKVTRIKSIEPIEGADMIELAVVDDYRSVVKKGQFQANSLCVYIPEGSLVPINILRQLGLEGKLSGPEKNRVKAAKFRGVLSQGILLYVDSGSNCGGPFISLPTDDGLGVLFAVEEQQDVANDLGITKYEPVIPGCMSGDVYNAGQLLTVNFDVENIKGFPDVLNDGEQVVFTEKLHGSFLGIGILPEQDWDQKHYRGKYVIFSKGQGARGLCFKDSERSLANVYFRAILNLNVFNIIEQNKTIFNNLDPIKRDLPFFILGEVFGKGVQDLGYNSNVSFRVFDICQGYRDNQTYLDYDTMKEIASSLALPTVPELYRGPFSKDLMKEYTSGYETVSGNNTHMREGIVIKPIIERYQPNLGRVCLKSVNEQYLLRRGNVTEFN